MKIFPEFEPFKEYKILSGVKIFLKNAMKNRVQEISYIY